MVSESATKLCVRNREPGTGQCSPIIAMQPMSMPTPATMTHLVHMAHETTENSIQIDMLARKPQTFTTTQQRNMGGQVKVQTAALVRGRVESSWSTHHEDLSRPMNAAVLFLKNLAPITRPKWMTIEIIRLSGIPTPDSPRAVDRG